MLQSSPITDKEYFSIGEVSQITLVPKYTLRYWESEFKLLRPVRENSGRRKYRKGEIDLVFKIKDLLYNQKYTIEGTKKYLIGDKRKKLKYSQGNLELKLEHVPDSEFLRNIKDELRCILKLLKK